MSDFKALLPMVRTVTIVLWDPFEREKGEEEGERGPSPDFFGKG